jgi:NTF2 fold immunity protein of polymorphic toxin system component
MLLRTVSFAVIRERKSPMKRCFLVLAILVTAFSYVHSQSQPSAQPKEDVVSNAEAAVKVAEAALIPVYGKKMILSERPFKATLDGDVWTVVGTVHCGAPRCAGGAAEVKISKSSGKILHMTHYK